ncbi:MAG: hypothetical protein M1449_07300 [Candidatus Thermoplasmatota archaeon]|nr:hypothetical protein [Candidatus Thermoplasmatota archaeon]
MEWLMWFSKPENTKPLAGGVFFLSGAVLMAVNMFMTIRQGKRESAALEARLAAKMARA